MEDLQDDEIPQQMDEDTDIQLTFQQANKVILVNDIYQTPVNIRFKCDDKGTAINLPEKHAKLLEILQSIDDSTYFSDVKQNAYEDPNTLLQCKTYDDTFTIDASQRNAGNIYVQCTMFSKLKINQFKHGEKNIMQYLKDQNIFILFRKFTQATETRIGFSPFSTLTRSWDQNYGKL